MKKRFSIVAIILAMDNILTPFSIAIGNDGDIFDIGENVVIENEIIESDSLENIQEEESEIEREEQESSDEDIQRDEGSEEDFSDIDSEIEEYETDITQNNDTQKWNPSDVALEREDGVQNSSTETTEIQTGSEVDTGVDASNRQEIIQDNGEQNNQNSGENNNQENVENNQDNEEQNTQDPSVETPEIQTGTQTGSGVDTGINIPQGQEEEKEGGVIETITEEIQDIIIKIRYFFKKEGDSRYIKYGRDSNNIGTITLKDPKTSASITIMDKNLGAESVGVGRSSYGYYFQWGNNSGVKIVNGSNKTTEKAIYKDSYYNRGYDGKGMFIVGGRDYWENGDHYNSLWGNESKESSRYGSCPVGYHIPTVKEWNQLLSIWGKIHTQDTTKNEIVLRYSADYTTKNIHTFKGAATQCAQGETECVDEDKLSIIIETLSEELKLPLAGSYDENGNYEEGLGVYWTTIAKDGNKAGVFDMNVYIGNGADERLEYKAQGHNIRCFQNVDPYEAPVEIEDQDGEVGSGENKIEVGSGENIVEENTQNGENQGLQENDVYTTGQQEAYTTGQQEVYTTGVQMYTITWKNEDGTIRDTTQVAYGDMPTHEDITQPADEKYTYTFAGREPEIRVVDGDAEYKAKYIYTANKSTITRKNEDGTIIDTTEVLYGKMPTHEDAYQPADAKYTYVFKGWEPEISNVVGPAEYRATYEYILNTYTVTWENEDGSILEEDKDVEYGTMPTYDGENPVKQRDGNVEYIFSGWETDISEVTGDVVYVARYDVVEISEDNGSGSDIVETNDLQKDDGNSDNILSGMEGNVDGGEGSGDEIIEIEDSLGETSEGEEQGFFEGLWETIKSFFLDDEDGYLRGSETINDIVVSVEAEEGTFPEGTEVVIKGVSQERLETIQTSLIEDESNNVTEDAQILAFDISFVYSGEEIQPLKEVSVKFNYKDNSDFQGSSMSELSVYHIDDDTDEGEEVEVVNKEGDEIEILATNFSTYAVVAQKGLRGASSGGGIYDQMSDFEFTGIVINRPDSISNGPTFYIIMDRNLGATSTDTNSTDSYGYMYQWGNNYGFPGTGTSLPSSQVTTKKIVSVNLTEYGPIYDGKTQYYSGIFITAPTSLSNNERYDWPTTANDNIWGHTTDKDEARQGPCPSGWHVPSVEEWSGAMAYWKAGSGNGSLNNFANYLHLPKAGSRARSTADLQKSGEGWFYTSTSTGKVAYALTFKTGAPSITAPNNRVDALSVRCFKDELICETGMHAELNGCVSNYKTGHCMTGDVQNGHYTGYMNEITIEWTGGAWNIPMCELVCDEGFHENDNMCIGGFVSVTFDLNGGRWYDGSIGNRDFPIEMGVDISNIRPKQDPYKNGYMFMGWFDESSNSAYRFKFQGTTLTGDLILTAHWAPFNDIVYTGIIGGEEKRVVLMDRNMGATMIGAGETYSTGSYGFYYQWGNNYGFYYDKGTHINTTTGGKYLNNSYGPNNWFYGESYYNINANDYMQPSNNNLWGGAGDSTGNNYDNGNKKYTRQGPCPKGYHVPSEGEWHKLILLFMNNNYPDHEITAALNDSWTDKIGLKEKGDYSITPTIRDEIVNIFKFPTAGRVTKAYQWNRQAGESSGNGGPRIPFWSSSPITNDTSIGFEIKFGDSKINIGGWPDERGTAKPVRCFKDLDDYTVTWKNYDGTVLETDLYVYEGATPSYNGLENPTKDELSEFTGWYLEGDENQTIVDLSTQSVNSDRAYVAKFIPIAPEDAYIVTVDVDPLTGGNVDKEPRYNSGDTVILTGIANSGYEFLGWFTGNDIVSLDNPYVFIADDSAGTGFTAVFSPLYSIYTGTNNQSGGTISYEVVDITRQGKTIRFTATPTEDFELDKWILNGDDVATGGTAQLDVILSGDISLTGYFIQVRNLPCNFNGEFIPNGESVTGYQLDSVTCPNACVSQVAICNNGEWNVADFDTEYSYSSCNYSGFICSVEEYPLSSCPSNGICSSCIGYGVSENVCNELSPVYKLEGCQDHYHVSGNVCELDTYKVMIQSSNINSGTVTTGSITVPYGTNISKSGNILEIGNETSTANPNSQTWQYDFAFVDWTDTCGTTITTGCTVTANFQSLLRTYTLDLVIGTGIETIYYKINGANGFINTGITTTISGVEAGSTIYTYAEAKDGYTYTETSESNPWSVTVTGDNIFAPEAIASGVQYIVYHYVKKVGENKYTLAETETGHGETDAVLVLSGLAKSDEYPCASYDRGSLTGTENGPGEIVTETMIKGDGSTKIYLYYNRNSYTVHLSGDAGIQSFEINGEERTEAVRECGSEVPVSAVPKPGYHLVRWDKLERKEGE